MEIITQLIPAVKLWPNTGQIAGLPANPRQINDDKFDKLVKSIIDHPEMLHLRECIVTPYADVYVILAGNMRHRAFTAVAAMSDDEFGKIIEEKESLDNFNEWFADISILRDTKNVPCKIVPKTATIEQLKAYLIKDNVSFGSHDWGMLANEWDENELNDWGMDIPNWDNEIEEEEEKQKTSVVRLVIEFDGDLGDYDNVKERIRNLIEEYPSAKLKE
jgi:hypothetical protein